MDDIEELCEGWCDGYVVQMLQAPASVYRDSWRGRGRGQNRSAVCGEGWDLANGEVIGDES
jgi:hypothetical protein